MDGTDPRWKAVYSMGGRSERLLRLALAAVLLAAALPVNATQAAVNTDYRYWFVFSSDKAYPNTLPPTSAKYASASSPTTLSVTAARAEAEGRQIVVRPVSTTLRDIWIQPSSFSFTDASGTVSTLPSSIVSTYKVGYVYVSRPSLGFRTVGYQPDPLLPMTLANGQRLGAGYRAVSYGKAQPFYVLFSVPDTATPGTYTGHVTITALADDGTPAPAVVMPVTLTVRSFSVLQRSLKTSFGIATNWAMYASTATHKWLPPGPASSTRVAETDTYETLQWGGWLKYMSDHRVSPQYMLPAWTIGSDGTIGARRAQLEDYLGSGTATSFKGDRLMFNSVKAPISTHPYVKNPWASSSYTAMAANYYSSMKAQLGNHLWKSYAYPIDEPPATARSFIEKYGYFIHAKAPGMKYFVTIDPRRFKYTLFRTIDIYGNKLPFFFRDYSAWIKKVRAANKKVWIYSYATEWQAVAPEYLVDGPIASSRVQGWFAWKTRADGLLHFSVNAWRPTMGTSTYRDPYKDPLSYRSTHDGRPFYANGDGSLVYPGYYPSLGLTVQGSPPVGSLRMEAVRDGLEDYEYLKLVSTRIGTRSADAYAAKIIGPVPTPAAGRLQFPTYKRTAWSYESVRNEMGARLSPP